jgi:hypothetical protein
LGAIAFMLPGQKILTAENLVMKSLILVAMMAAIAFSTVVPSQAGSHPRYSQDCTWVFTTVPTKDCGNSGGDGGGD